MEEETDSMVATTKRMVAEDLARYRRQRQHDSMMNLVAIGRIVNSVLEKCTKSPMSGLRRVVRDTTSLEATSDSRLPTDYVREAQPR